MRQKPVIDQAKEILSRLRVCSIKTFAQEAGWSYNKSADALKDLVFNNMAMRMENKMYSDMLPPDETRHFSECMECGKMFDCRNLDEVLFHCDHAERIDIPYSGSRRIENNGNA